jgi:probable F420-dependent oxidoreductase
MDLGLFLAAANPFTSPEVLRAVGEGAEARGLHSIWVPEHVVLFDDYESPYPYAEDGRIPGFPGSGMLEPLTTLTFLAACTTTVRLGTAIVLLPQRNPVYVAKETANVDYLSNGRLDFGIGAGWLREEFDVCNVPFEQRGKRTDEYLDVVKALWCDDPSEFHGDTYDLPPCNLHPKPVQTPHPPIHVGGESDAALRRVARHGQGWITFNRAVDDVTEGIDRLTAALVAEGRSRDEVRVTLCPSFQPLDADAVAAYAAVGVDELIPVVFVDTVDAANEALDELVPYLDAAR